jgi:acetolactate synthase-1/3 small subunit
MKHTIVALVENKPGVLNRVASLFRRRNFNIDSLTVGRTDNPHISRMTIVMDSDADPDQVQKQLYKLINVIQVEDVTHLPGVSRDLALIKIQVDSTTRAEVVQLCDIFRARIVDVTPESVIVEITGDEQKIDSLLELLRPIGIIEMVRTGVVTMTRGENVMHSNGYKPRTVGNGHRATIL